jgi:hypothetical protein
LVAGPGIEPGTEAYETSEMPFLYPASVILLIDKYNMLKILFLSVALSAGDLSIPELEKYYWDCDTLFMKDEMGPDVMSCLAITDAFIEKKFKNDQKKFKEYWNRSKIQEWRKRGYIHKQV